MGTAVLNTPKVLMYCGLYKNVCDILHKLIKNARHFSGNMLVESAYKLTEVNCQKII